MKRRKIENNTGSASVSYSYNRRKVTYNGVLEVNIEVIT